MKIKRSETGTYFVEPVCDEDVRFMDALMVAVDAFEKAYYPMDTVEGEAILSAAPPLDRVSVAFKEKHGSVENTLTIEAAGSALGSHSTRDEVVSLLLAKIQSFGKDDGI